MVCLKTHLYYIIIVGPIYHVFINTFVKILKFKNLDELTREEDVLEWLVQNKSTGDEEDVIEDVTSKTLDTLIGSVDNLVVLFCKVYI